MVFKQLQKTDSLAAAKIHINSFPNFFLTSLGQSFLEKFYEAIISSENGIYIGAFDDEETLIGFAVGAKSKNKFYSQLIKKNFLSLISSCFLKLLLKPNKIVRLITSLTSNETVNREYINSSILLSICVSPFKQGLNIGQHLLANFEIEVQKENYQIILTTDSLNNERVNKFYIRNGYILLNKYLQGSREMNLYHKKLL